MTDIHNGELVDLLATHSVANVQNGLIHALAIWLDQHLQEEPVEQRKREAFSVFTSLVRDVVMQRQFERKMWPQNQPLPYPYNEMEVIESISDQALQKMIAMPLEKGLMFLAELWGAWILVCPAKIIQNSPEFASDLISVKTESERNELMLRYLEMVYGMM
jgi:hypothetical protein